MNRCENLACFTVTYGEKTCPGCGYPHHLPVEEQPSFMEALKGRYATQDNRGTAWPIYVTVQELTWVGMSEEDTGGFGDGEVVTKYDHPNNDEGLWETREEVEAWLKDSEGLVEGEELEEEKLEVIERHCLYVWKDVEFFLTIAAAEEFMITNKHNMGKTRTYVKHFNSRNREMTRLTKEIGLRVE
jgi:hypothetical protein